MHILGVFLLYMHFQMNQRIGENGYGRENFDGEFDSSVL